MAGSFIRTMTDFSICPAPKLVGRHQFINAGTAIAALRCAGIKLPPAAFETGLIKAEWPARMQRLQGKLNALAPAGSRNLA